MQGGFKYKGAGTKVPTYKPITAPLTENQELYQSLQTQYENLGKRLEAVGANQIADNRSFLEKIFNLPDEQGPLLDIIEVIERPMRGIQAGLMSLNDGGKFWAGVWEGFSGNRRFTGVEFADEMGWLRKEDLTGTQNFLLNVGIDIVMDPFTYIAPVKLAKKIFKWGGQPIVGNLDEPLKKIATKMADANIDFTRATGQQIIDFGKQLDEPIDILLDADLDKLYTGKGSNELFRYIPAETPGVAGEAYELALGDLQAKLIEQSLEPGLEYMVLGSKTANRAVDNVIARGFTAADGSKVWVPVRNIEVKDLFTGAYGPNKLGLELAEDGSRLTLQQTDVLGRLSDETKENLQKFLDDLTVQAKNKQQPLAEYVKSVLEPGFEVKRTLEKTLRTGGGAAKDWLNRNVFANIRSLDEIFNPKYLADLELTPAQIQDAIQQFNIMGVDWAVMNRNTPLTGVAADLYRAFTTNSDASRFLITNPEFNKFVAAQKELVKAPVSSVGFTLDSLGKKFNLDKKTSAQFIELLRDLASGSQNGKWYSFFEEVDGEQILRVIRGENLLPRLNITGNLRFSELGKVSPTTRVKGARIELSTRIASGKKLMRDPDFIKLLDDEMELFMDNLVVRGVDEPFKMQVQLLQKFKQSKYAPVRAVADITDKTINWFQYSFNPRAGVADDLIGDIRRIEGSVGVQANRNMRRLAFITEELTAINPKAADLARQAIEAKAYIDKAGAVRTRFFNPKLTSILDNVKGHAKVGKSAVLPTWGKTGAELDLLARNLQDVLNKAYFDIEAVDDAFKVYAKDGALLLDLNAIDSATLQKIDFSVLGDQKFTGRGYKLSDEVKEFFLENSEMIQEYQNLKFGIVDTLKKELGYEHFDEALKLAPEYIPHTLSDAAKDFFKQQRPAARSKFIQEGVDLLKNREWAGTIDDVNKGFRAINGVDFDFFDTNLQNAFEDLIAVASIKTEQDKILGTLLKASSDTGQPLFQVIPNNVQAAKTLGYSFDTIKKFDETYSDIYKNLSEASKKELNDYLAKLGYDPNTSALGIHRTAKNMLDNINRSYKEIDEVIRNFDNFQAWWKSITLVTPGYISRNLFGNDQLMSFAGMNLFSRMRYAGRATNDFAVLRKLNAQLAEFSGSYDDFLETLTKADREAYERIVDFYEAGVSQSYGGARDIADVGKMVREGKPNIAKQIIAMNYDIAQRTDDFQRYMLYQWARDNAQKNIKDFAKLDAWKAKARLQNEAGKVVSEAMYDYKHYTSFEKEWMKRIFPFYTFFKNNLVFQIQTLYRNPGAVGRAGRLYKYFAEDIAGVDVEQMPDYMLGNMWIPIPAQITTGDTEAIAFLKTNLPLSDFTEMIENPLKRGVGSVAAPIKLVFELGAGVDFFTGSPLQDFPGEQDRMDPGSGVLSGIRNEDGDFALSANPIAQKIANEMGFRVPRNYLSLILDVADTVAQEQTGAEGVLDVMERFGLTATTNTEDMQMAKVYQLLEDLRYTRDRYEQATGQGLPTKADLGIDQPPAWMNPIR